MAGKAMRVEWFVAAVLLASGLAVASAGEPEGLAKLPVNHWVKLPCKTEPGYVWSALVYVPSRGQILHWGATANPAHSRDDVRAFDLATMDWVSDYPSAPAEVLRKSADPEGGKSVRVWGTWAMLPETARPAPSWTVNAVTYDSKRKQVVFALRGMMAAYDPATRTWRDLKAETELNGKWSLNPSTPYGMFEHGLRPEQDFHNHRIPGPPPVYGAGICYDPVNDEIVLFPHWGSQNNDLRPFTGRVSSHSGTWIYSFKDNVWRRPLPILGDALMASVSRALDGLWYLWARPDPGKREELEREFSALETYARSLPQDVPNYGLIFGMLNRMTGAYRRGKSDALMTAGIGLLKFLEGCVSDWPPPCCGAKMIPCDPSWQLAFFGGQTNEVRSDLPAADRNPQSIFLEEAWGYTPKMRNARGSFWDRLPWGDVWHERVLPGPLYDDLSRLVLMIAFPVRVPAKGRVELWGLDFEAETLVRFHEEPWPWGATDWATVALDPKNRMLLMARGGKESQETFAFRFDREKLPPLGPQPAPVWGFEPPVKPQEVPPDDPAWLAKLKELPANTWVMAKPAREAERRDWGTLACDPVRGLVFYFGGGHSTYQVNDVSVYAVGANTWCFAPGDSNSPIPPHDWDGCTMSVRGGPPAGHQRNSYLALDGRMFVHAGTHSRRWDAEIAKEKGIRVAWFYDLDRGGVWRQREIEKVELGEGVPGSYGRLHVADPAGKLYGFAGHLEPYDGRFFSKEAYVSTYDVYDNQLTVRKIPEPTPGWVGECRPFCLVENRDSHLFSKGIFFYECRKDGGHATWVYDIAANRFTDLKPPHQPPAEPRTVEYIDSQKCVLAIIGQGEQWVYSFEKNDWSPLPLKVEGGKMGFQTPYAQMVWVAKYGVLVNVCGSTWLMRPEIHP